jgi:hypothetical protein
MVNRTQSVCVQCGRSKPYLFVYIVTQGDISTALTDTSLVVFFSTRITIGHLCKWRRIFINRISQYNKR